jgi:hypothetical protein
VVTAAAGVATVRSAVSSAGFALAVPAGTVAFLRVVMAAVYFTRTVRATLI